MKRVPFVLIAIFIAAASTGCKTTTTWNYKQTIAKPIIAKSSNRPIVLGSLAKNKVTVSIKGKTFDAPTKVTIQTPGTVPAVPAGKFEPIGSPVEISSAQRRENKPLKFTMKVDDKYLRELRTGEIWVAYHNGSAWELIKPSSVDIAAKTIAFQSYHMSLFGTAKISAEERVSKYTRSKAIGKMAQDNADEIIERNIKENLEIILKDHFGMDDETFRYKMISSLVNDDEYREIAGKLMAGDAKGFNQDMMVFFGKKIAEEVPKSTLKGMLETLSAKEGVGYTEAFSQALGFIAEKDFQSAGEVITEQLVKNTPVAQLFKGAGEIVQSNIEMWKDSEIEAAYQAYKNGADDGFWGYNVDKGNFDQVYNQMKGIAVRLEGEYVERELTRRASLSMREPTESELAKIRDQLFRDLKKQFDLRVKNDDRIAADTERMNQLISKFEEAKLLDDNSFGYDKDYDKMEDRLDRLFKLSEKILRDTKRKGWSMSAFTNEKTISVNDMVALMQAWYSTNGKDLYAQMLKDKFGGGGSGPGIQGDFALTGGDPMYGANSGAQAIMMTALLKRAPLKIEKNRFSASDSQQFSATGNSKAQGNGWIKLSGTYDPETAMLSIEYEFGWDVIQNAYAEKDQKEKVVYAGNTKQKITPGDKSVFINYKGTITSTSSSLRIDGWTKPFTTTSNGGGPGARYKVEME